MNRKIPIIFLLFILLVLAALSGISFGPVRFNLGELLLRQNSAILNLRIARVILGLIAGIGLASSGVIFQGILRNPLAEPYVLGISSGAGLGAVLALFFKLNIELLPLSAFLGSALTMFFVYQLSKTNGKVSTYSLLLSGVIVGAVFSSLLLFFVSISQNEAMHGITWWLLGSLQVFDVKLLVVVGVITLSGFIISIYLARDLNAICLGDEEAEHLGINVEAIKRILFIIASLITGSIVCVCGIIGFVGLIIPHAVRLIAGSDHRIILPASAISAGAFLILSDAIGRVIIPPVEVPIGVITAIIGGPVFIFLLRRKQKLPS